MTSAEVNRSMQVDPTSKTPYSDATQVIFEQFCVNLILWWKISKNSRKVFLKFEYFIKVF